MTPRPLTDAALGAELRRLAPTHARADLRERIRTDVEHTPQQRRWPSFLAALSDADPAVRRRALLVAAALLLLLSVSTAIAVGAWLANRTRPAELAIEPPSDLIAFVASAYAEMPELPPLSLTALEDGARKIRIHVDASGAVRIERYASADAAEPESYTIYAGTSIGELLRFEGRSWWYEQPEAISEDPRVFVYATLGGAGWSSGTERCQTVLSDPSADPAQAGRDIRYVGAEYVIGRPTHRVRCLGDRWIDLETRLVLRAVGPAFEAGVPVAGQTRSIEVTELTFAQPPADLFEIARPPDVPVIDADDYSCASDPFCRASPRPVATPPPAPVPGVVPEDLDALAAGVGDALTRLPAFEATFRRTNTKYPGSEVQVHHDGRGRYRLVETREMSGGDAPTITLIDPEGSHQSMTREDGAVVWVRLPGSASVPPSPISIGAPCPEGWEHAGVDLVAGGIADRLDCPTDGVSYWIDRELGIAVRAQSSTDARYGTDVVELVRLHLGDQPAHLFVLPDDALVAEP